MEEPPVKKQEEGTPERSVPVDPRFVRHFGLQIWKRAQEKEYFEQRKAHREWWWNHTVVLAWRCLTWAHISILFLGTLSVAKSLFWIRVNWLLLSVVAQSTCQLGEHVERHCFFSTNSSSSSTRETIQILARCPNATAPLTTRFYRALFFYDPSYYYTWIPQSLEQMVVGPFVMAAFYYRYYTMRAMEQWPWLYLTGMACDDTMFFT